MKKLFLAACVFTSLLAVAQKPASKLVLNQGQKILIKSSTVVTSSASVMGQEMENSSNSVSEDIVEVKSVAANNNVVTKTLTKASISASAMGQEINYNSDNAEDKGSMLAGAFEKSLKIAKEYTIDDKAVITKYPAEDADAAAGKDMMSGMPAPAGEDTDLGFMLFPATKPGDTWTDSSVTNNVKTVNFYTLKSIDADVVTIDITGKITGRITMEQMGMEMQMNMNNTVAGSITVDAKTGIKKVSVLNITMNNNIEASGMSIPVTGKTVTTLTYTVQN